MTKSFNRILFLIGVFILSILTLLAILYYKERTIFVDIAFFTFHLINDKFFLLGNYRLAGGFTQGITLLFVFAGASLKTILIEYSLVYMLFYWLCFLTIGIYFKNKTLAFLQAFSMILMGYDSFYWIQSELQLGTSFLFVYLAFLENFNFKKPDLKFYLINLLLIVFMIFSHPLMIIPLMFVLVQIGFVQKKIAVFNFIISSTISIGVYLVKKKFLSNAYEQGKDFYFQSLIKHSFSYLHCAMTQSFLTWLRNDYYVWGILFLIISTSLIFLKRWKSLAALLIFTFGLITIIISSFFNGGEKFYHDNYFRLLGVFTLIVLYFDFRKSIENKIGIVVLLSVVLLRLNLIYHAHEPYTERINWLKNKVAECHAKHISHLAIPFEKVNLNQLKMSWGMAYESIIYSSLNNKNESVTFFLTNDSTIIKKGNSLHSELECVEMNAISKEYFQLPNQPYSIEQ